MPSDSVQPSPKPVEFKRSIVHFPSGKEQCHAWLYWPQNANNSMPIIVMAHGLGAIKKAGLAPFAERFCAAGYPCLVFDYRYFGDSGGQPRELLDIPSQLEDWRAAVKFARCLDNVDPNKVIVWGTSFGGGHATITAAEDDKILAAIAQCPFTDGPSSVMTIPMQTNLKVTALALQDIAADKLGKGPIRVSTVGQPGETALMTAADALSGYYALIHQSGLEDIPTQVSARIGLQIAKHRPGAWAKKVKCPILFVVCNQDSVAPAKATLKHAAKAPKGEIIQYNEGHFEIYLGEAFEQNIADQLDFLRRHVPLD